MQPDNIKLLETGINQLELELEASQIERLIGYHDLLLEWNEKFNLIGFKDERDSLVQNLLNALGPWRQIFPRKHTCDIGSGAGFPGIPLAIALNMSHMTLIESKSKKARFLTEATSKFSPEVQVINQDANSVKESYRQIIFCAVGKLDKILGIGEKLLHSGGRILAYKGKRETIEEEKAKCKARHQKWEIVPFNVPGMEAGAQRHLAIYHSRT